VKLAIVTATTDPQRAWPCIKTWTGWDYFVGVVNGRPFAPNEKPAEQVGALTRDWVISPEYLGSVGAFRLGVDFALKETNADIICCLHDDVEMLEPAWTNRVLRHFDRHPACGLAGFGGALGLGDDDLYKTPYRPMQLARKGFRSNLVDAEVHGYRSLIPERVACLDGFSQIGRRAFWDGDVSPYLELDSKPSVTLTFDRPLREMEVGGVVHHFYDGLLGCYAARYGWETWFIPVRCKHLGGQTAVGDQGYQAWAEKQTRGGDQGFWEQAHRWGYEEFRDVLPLRV